MFKYKSYKDFKYLKKYPISFFSSKKVLLWLDDCPRGVKPLEWLNQCVQWEYTYDTSVRFDELDVSPVEPKIY